MLQSDVQDNRNQIATNAQNINDVGTQVGQLMSDIGKRITTTPDMSVCAPLWATVNAEMQDWGTDLTQIAAHAASSNPY